MNIFTQLAIETIKTYAAYRYYANFCNEVDSNRWTYFHNLADNWFDDHKIYTIYQHSPLLCERLAEKLRDSWVFFNNDIPCIYSYSLSYTIIKKWVKSKHESFITFVMAFSQEYTERNFYSLYDNWSLEAIKASTHGKKFHNRVEVIQFFINKMIMNHSIKQHIKVETIIPPLNLF